VPPESSPSGESGESERDGLYRRTDMAYWRQFDIADRDGNGSADLSLEDVYAYC